MKLLITGGAGFIGSNLLQRFVTDERFTKIRILDNLSNGSLKNIEEFLDNDKVEFIEGDIRNLDTCLSSCEGIDVISHQAALGSVPRSIENPVLSNEVNVGGSVNIMFAAHKQGVKRIVHAFSSSTYGSNRELPKREDKIGSPLSPYAITKYTNELYADIFNRIYGLEYIGLRYFNVFGPKQDPHNPYAAVIPLYCNAFLHNENPLVNGDGENSRDFTYVENAILANELAIFTDKTEAINQVYNVACGERVSLLEMINMLRDISGKDIEPRFMPPRDGDIKHSLADISKIKSLLGYQPRVLFREGLQKVYEWYTQKNT